MPGGGGGGNGLQTTVNTTQLPEWVSRAAFQNTELAGKVAQRLQKPYTGNLVPGFTADQNSAFAATRGAQGMAQPAINAGIAATQDAANFNPSTVTASTVRPGTFLTGDIQRYLNPQTANIENRALDTLDRQRRSALGQIGGQAASMGAFGGSRQAILEGVTNAESARAAGDLSANLRGQAFDRATALMTGDQNRVLQGDLANQAARLEAARSNQAAGLTANQQQILAGSQLGALGGQRQEAALQGAAALQSSGNQQQQLQAAKLAQNAANYEALRGFPLEQLNIKMQALGMAPYGQTTTSTGPSTTQKSNPFLSALGGAGTGAGIASALKLGGTASAGTTGLGALLGLLSASDEELKTDKQKVGSDPQTGVPLYAYRYKGDPKSYPKVVGPMAQDVAKVAPAAVRRMPGRDGKLAVNLGFPTMRKAFA